MIIEKLKNVVSDDVFEVLKKMADGNQRFINNQHIYKDFITQRKGLVSGQKPQVIILTCSDSRIDPAYIFDNDLGSSFIIRTAGNVVDSAAEGSIEYAVKHLGVKLLLILGHEGCGGVKAAFAGGSDNIHLAKTLSCIIPAVRYAKVMTNNDGDALYHATIENVKNQIKRIYFDNPSLLILNQENKFFIVGAYYHLESGKVDFII